MPEILITLKNCFECKKKLKYDVNKGEYFCSCGARYKYEDYKLALQNKTKPVNLTAALAVQDVTVTLQNDTKPGSSVTEPAPDETEPIKKETKKEVRKMSANRIQKDFKCIVCGRNTIHQGHGFGSCCYYLAKKLNFNVEKVKAAKQEKIKGKTVKGGVAAGRVHKHTIRQPNPIATSGVNEQLEALLNQVKISAIKEVLAKIQEMVAGLER